MTTDDDTEFGTRWLRSLVLAVPALAVAGVLGWLIARGTLASTITVQSGTLSLATSGVYGTEFGLTVGNNTVEGPTGAVSSQRTARIGFSSAKLEGLCLAEPQSIAGQNFTVMLTAGQSDQFSISSGLLIMDVTSIGGGLYGDGEVDLGVSGQNISTLSAPLWPAGNPLGVDTATTPNPFGLQASITDFGPVTGQVRLMQLQQSITLPNLNISVQPGTVSCPTPPAPTNWPTPPS
jgi:hypothetical protein